MYQGCLNVVSSWDWGSVPEWVAGAVTAGAFVLAARTYRRNSRDNHQTQARKVYGVLEPSSMRQWTKGTFYTGVRLPDLRIASSSEVPSSLLSPTNHAQDDFWTGVLEVKNGSDEVITNVIAHVRDYGNADSSLGWGGIDNVTLRPDQTTYQLVYFTTDDMASCLPNREVVVHFKDSAGIDWRRIENHPIEEYPLYGTPRRGLRRLVPEDWYYRQRDRFRDWRASP